MDCNKEQALKTKEEAERKFAEKDYVEAKNLAQQAKDMFPELDFISLFITIIDVYISREKNDWHGVLGLEKTNTIPKTCGNYLDLIANVRKARKKVIGAEGALQIVSEALCVVAETFWTRCSNCKFRFQYGIRYIDKEILCVNCHKSYVAVPTPPGFHPMNPKTMIRFERKKTSVVLALCAPSANLGGVRKQPSCSPSKKECFMFACPYDSEPDGDADEQRQN